MLPTIKHMLCLILAALISQANADSITRLSHGENRILSSLGHHMDQAAMNVFHNDFPHERQRRGVYDKFKATVQHTQSISERQSEFQRNVIPCILSSKCPISKCRTFAHVQMTASHLDLEGFRS